MQLHHGVSLKPPSDLSSTMVDIPEIRAVPGARNARSNRVPPPPPSHQPNAPVPDGIYPAAPVQAYNPTEAGVPTSPHPNAASQGGTGGTAAKTEDDECGGAVFVPLFFFLGAFLGLILGPFSFLFYCCLRGLKRRRNCVSFGIGAGLTTALGVGLCILFLVRRRDGGPFVRP